jgi:predicted acylesterase/phospholipase RssA
MREERPLPEESAATSAGPGPRKRMTQSRPLSISRGLVLALPLIIGPFFASCSLLRTPGVLKALSGTKDPTQPEPDEFPTSARIAELVRAHLADSYMDPRAVSEWLRSLGSKPQGLISLALCLANATLSPGEPQCYDQLGPAAEEWGVPARPVLLTGLARGNESTVGADVWTTPAASKELDAQRFLANLSALGSSLGSFQTFFTVPPSDSDLRAGIRDGAERAAAYILARKWHRTLVVPSTAVVISGGAANGAFSAGFIWRLLDVISDCQAHGSCPSSKLDLVVGTSTGALISVLLDMSEVPGQRPGASAALLDDYTCKVDRDLFCVNDTWSTRLATDLPGLVRFDGIQRLMERLPLDAMLGNETELVTVSVEYNSGHIVASSDQDPEDTGTTPHRLAAIMASVVEPVLAEPIDAIAHAGTFAPGTFVDGGVRSELPLMEAVRRGAERVLVLASSGIEPDSVAKPQNALAMLRRTLALLGAQVTPGELTAAEGAAVQRRWLEYNICLARLASPDAGTIEDFCQRRGQGVFGGRTVKPTVGVPAWQGPGYFAQVASSWHTVWIFRPETPTQVSYGYKFDPRVMRPLFELGISTFQARCLETLDLFGIPPSNYCNPASAKDALTRATRQYRPYDICRRNVDTVRKCPPLLPTRPMRSFSRHSYVP